ncbi:hypothetical protein Liucustia_03 [Acinetobacter phage Liucustia]|nr:hypothetical protein Liucustia_03 [Acinetobacter phage Liucustia]
MDYSYNNHVPHKIKKRIMKKADSIINQRVVDIFWRNVRYYNTIKMVKSLDAEAGRYLEKRLRQKNVITKDANNNAFTGSLMFDFVWSKTPQGMQFWNEVDSKLRKFRAGKLLQD